jgi:hypothetical protein
MALKSNLVLADHGEGSAACMAACFSQTPTRLLFIHNAKCYRQDSELPAPDFIGVTTLKHHHGGCRFRERAGKRNNCHPGSEQLLPTAPHRFAS